MTLGLQLLSCVMCEILFDLLYTFLQNIADWFEQYETYNEIADTVYDIE